MHLVRVQVELLEARLRRAASQQVVVVKKQSKVLENIMGHLTKVLPDLALRDCMLSSKVLSSCALTFTSWQLTLEESNERVMKEEEWRQRNAYFHKQHREMEVVFTDAP